MHENNYPSDELVQISSLMNPLDVEGKLGHVLKYGQKFSSDFRYDRAQKHWDNTLTYLNEAIRQTLREGISKEKLESLLQTDDNRILTLFLTGMSLRTRYGSFPGDTLGKVHSTIRTHSSRSVREAGLILLESNNYLRPTPAVLKSRKQQMHRDGLTLDDYDKWRILRTSRWAVFDDSEDYTIKSYLFEGQTRKWEFQNAYPIMALLWYAGLVELPDLLYIDPNRDELARDFTTLSKLGEVDTVDSREGLLGKKRTLFKIAKSGYWSGPPW